VLKLQFHWFSDPISTLNSATKEFIMCSEAGMSFQSDGTSKKSSFNSRFLDIMLKEKRGPTFVIGDCEVDCNMKIFQPLSISYTDFTDWYGT